MYRILRVCCLFFCGFLSALSARADTVTYTFEPPQFFTGDIVPLENREPNSGSSTFLATFASDSPNTFRIANIELNPLFSGQSLLNPAAPSVLTISFNIPVTQVEFVFGLELPGFLTFTSPSGSLSQDGADVGGLFPGGVFVFSSSTPFTMFQLASFDLTGAPSRFAIDNLTMNEVPEPATIVIFGAGLVGLATRLRRRN